MSLSQFDSFWEAYPIKKEKKKAMEKFLKLKPDLYDKIISSLKIQKESCENFKYFKHPTTWINGECWNDETETYEKSMQEYVREFKECGGFTQFRRKYLSIYGETPENIVNKTSKADELAKEVEYQFSLTQN